MFRHCVLFFFIIIIKCKYFHRVPIFSLTDFVHNSYPKRSNPISLSEADSDSSAGAAAAVSSTAAATGAASETKADGSAKKALDFSAAGKVMSVAAATAISCFKPLAMECGAEAKVG